MPRVLWDRFFSIDVPDEWEFDEEEGVVTLFHPNGVGFVRTSYSHDNQFWDRWVTLGATHLAFMTYNCEPSDRATEVAIRTQIAESFRFESSASEQT